MISANKYEVSFLTFKTNATFLSSFRALTTDFATLSFESPKLGLIYFPCAIPRVFSTSVAFSSISICLSDSSRGITPASTAASNAIIAPTVLSPSPDPPCDSTGITVHGKSAVAMASFKSSPIIILAQVPAIPINSGLNAS